MQFLRRILWTIGIMLVLTAGALILPGYAYLISAQRDTSPHERATHYEAAAQYLLWRPALYQDAAFAALEAGERARAIALFQTARQKLALTPAGQFELGRTYFLEGDQEKAITEWEALPPDDPITANSAPLLASFYHDHARFDDEAHALRRWLALDPKNADAQYRLALLLFADASPDALPLLEAAAANAPTLKPAADGLHTALKIAFENASPAARLTYCGQTLAAGGLWPLALRAFSRAVEADGLYALAWAWLGEARQQTGSGDPLAALQRAVTLDPNLAQARALFALYWQRQGDWQKAREAFETAAHLEPQNAAWRISLGQVYVHLGDLVTALAYYQEAVTVSPGDAQAWRALALFSIENNMDVDNLARQAALRAYALNPDDAQNLDVLGRTMVATEQYDTAEVFFKKALEIAPQDAAPAYHLALLYLATNQLDLAKKYLESARTLDPDGPIGNQAATTLARYFP